MVIDAPIHKLYIHVEMGRLIHRIQHYIRKLKLWLTLCHKPISYRFRNKTSWIFWDYCLKLSNTPQGWWCRPNLERHKKETSWLQLLESRLVLIFHLGWEAGEGKTPTHQNQLTHKIKNYVKITITYSICVYIYSYTYIQKIKLLKDVRYEKSETFKLKTDWCPCYWKFLLFILLFHPYNWLSLHLD